LLLFLALCLAGGGSNLPSVPALVILRPLAILLVAAFLMMPARPHAAAMRVPVLLLAAFTATIAVQLVPLPPELWSRIPGRSDLAELVNAVGQGAVWRPLTLTPTITVSSLMATLTGWVVVLAFTRLPARRSGTLAGVVILMALASCIVGLFQVIGGTSSVFYFYKTDGSISGLLGNRNHQAAFLAATLPLLRVWMLAGPTEARLRRGIIAGLLGVFILGMILLTGSRSGLVLAMIGTVAAYTIAPVSFRTMASGERRTTGRAMLGGRALRWGLLALPLLLVGATIWAGRDLSIQRLFTADYANETRLRALPTTLALVRDYFPFGSGFGSFDTVFRLHEPDALLKPTFFNRAHNDFLELAITGGLPSVLVLAAFLCWVAWKGFDAFRSSWRDAGVLHARAGVVTIIVLAAASVSDYPLRAPLISAVAVIAACWIARVQQVPARVSKENIG
jgi:O-antigen ligase